jgi:signal transduction histidine kinase
MTPLALHIAFAAALAESVGLAVLLLARAGAVPGMRYLVGFLIGVGAWIASCELPNWFGADAIPAAESLVALSPLTSAVFLHFVLVFCHAPRSPAVLAAVYAVAGATTLCALLVHPGEFEPWLGVDYFFMPNSVGWAVGAVWAGLAIAGHGVMLLSWLQLTGQARRQVTAMCLASGWGSLCMAGYGFPPLGIEVYPYPLLLLPAYPIILVYGILRYQLMIVNAWARRAVGWALLVGLGSVVVIGVAALPLPFGAPTSGWRLWVVAVGTVFASGLLIDPFRRLATRIVYPGSHLPDGAAEQWRQALAGAETYPALAELAAHEISGWLRMSIDVSIATDQRQTPRDSGGPALVCARRADGWHTEPVGWEAAPPGPRHVAQLFGIVVAEAAQRLEQAVTLAEIERERQRQARLAELGALAATVAHDIRNPLNIIAMAAASAAPETRREIAVQTSRISRLASDLLDYAKPWQINRRTLELADQIRTLTGQYPELEISVPETATLRVDADPRRLAQLFTNLLDNARAAREGSDGQIRIMIEATHGPEGSSRVRVCDNGAGIPSEIRETLFQPFVSRSPEGTGLGLAIAAKIMEAHGGSICLTDHPGWQTCFTLTFPAPQATVAPDPVGEPALVPSPAS